MVVSTLALSWISIELATWGEISLFVLGFILVAAMLAAPEGVFATIGTRLGKITAGKTGDRTTEMPAPTGLGVR